jgi:hypothetical protein
MGSLMGIMALLQSTARAKCDPGPSSSFWIIPGSPSGSSAQHGTARHSKAQHSTCYSTLVLAPSSQLQGFTTQHTLAAVVCSSTAVRTPKHGQIFQLLQTTAAATQSGWYNRN